MNTVSTLFSRHVDGVWHVLTETPDGSFRLARIPEHAQEAVTAFVAEAEPCPPPGTRVTTLFATPLRYEAGEKGTIEANDYAEKYDFRVKLDSGETYYFYRGEIEIDP